MKYTNYVINGNSLHYDEFGVIAIPTVIFAIPVLIGFLGGAVLMDGGRLIKLRYLLYMRQQRKVRYLKNVMVSLGHNESEWIILKAA